MIKEVREIKEHVYDDLKYAKIGTEEYERMVDCIVKVEKLEIESEKAENEKIRIDRQTRRDIWDLILKHSINVIGIATTAYVTIFLFAEGMRFEKEDAFRSTTMRNFMSKNLFKLR